MLLCRVSTGVVEVKNKEPVRVQQERGGVWSGIAKFEEDFGSLGGLMVAYIDRVHHGITIMLSDARVFRAR